MKVEPNGALVGGLAVALVGHVLGADRAHVVLDVLVEHRVGARGEVGHDVLAEQAAVVGEAVGVLVGRRVEHQARVLPGPRGEHDHAGGLDLLLVLLVVILDARHLVARGVGEHARHRAPRPHLGAGLAGVGQERHQRIGERADRAAHMAPAVIDAGGAALELDRVHADRGRHHADAVRLEALEPDLAVLERLHRRHRIGLALRPPHLLGLGVAGHADLLGDLVVPGRDVVVGDRPVEGAAVLALDAEIVRQQAREIGEVVQRRAADAPAALGAHADGCLPSRRNGRARRLDAAAPDVGADEVGGLPVRPACPAPRPSCRPWPAPPHRSSPTRRRRR